MSTASLERRLIALDRELHDILDMVKTQKAKETKSNVVENSAGAWGYDVESAEFVDGLRKSKRLDWI
ncbi:MAG: hypothetical protein OIN89_08090 [Candidatus Methanoperedens sp.]|jgi:hypothetical protein|nr:hypothetical protein [Candidatus Methanoperedens sp.]PKL53431.1 MAG: hypothetical protein CVV36_07135 [Candidatus Methanoperedenaceae archaeon HGW-Methanoperedenaceae-1]